MTAFDNDRWEAARKDRLERAGLPEIHWRAIIIPPRPKPATLFDRCVRAGEDADLETPADLTAITRAVLQTLLDHTESPRTAEEVSRVLAEGVA